MIKGVSVDPSDGNEFLEYNVSTSLISLLLNGLNIPHHSLIIFIQFGLMTCQMFFMTMNSGLPESHVEVKGVTYVGSRGVKIHTDCVF